MLHKYTIRLAGLALVAVPLAASAADSGERPKFGEADANGDGAISIEEARKAGVPKEEAKREDIDNDGELTKADWRFVDMNPGGGDGGSSS